MCLKVSRCWAGINIFMRTALGSFWETEKQTKKQVSLYRRMKILKLYIVFSTISKQIVPALISAITTAINTWYQKVINSDTIYRLQ